jgi:hypothetical protein
MLIKQSKICPHCGAPINNVFGVRLTASLLQITNFIHARSPEPVSMEELKAKFGTDAASLIYKIRVNLRAADSEYELTRVPIRLIRKQGARVVPDTLE